MSEQIDEKVVFENLEKILNNAEEVLVMKRPIEVLLLVQSSYDTAKGLIRIGNKVMEFKATVSYPDGAPEIDIEIGKKLWFTIHSDSTMKVLSKKEGEQK